MLEKTIKASVQEAAVVIFLGVGKLKICGLARQYPGQNAKVWLNHQNFRPNYFLNGLGDMNTKIVWKAYKGVGFVAIADDNMLLAGKTVPEIAGTRICWLAGVGM